MSSTLMTFLKIPLTMAIPPRGPPHLFLRKISQAPLRGPEVQEQKVKLLQVTNATRVDPRPTPSLQKPTLAQRHAEVSTMLNKVWGKPDEEMRELADLEDGLKEFFAKHKEVRQTTRKLHEDLRVHVLEQITEIEGLRQNAENSQKAIQLLETRLQEETAKHSSLDELSAKVKVLEAENESLKTFIQESSNKETQARKELSDKHARVLADLNEKLEKSQGRVISLGFSDAEEEEEGERVLWRRLRSSVEHSRRLGDDSEAGSGDSDGDDSTYQESEEEDSE
ncbi:hypothetical protein QYE76_008646 [Lolium multiflorum]|uniref:Uncharacterized protein n=1 Tax=Lolium multiflorum TaxID=4521 RepID=A0AAD8TTB8_LOLMU|nr:hypothetical protein QYE76_008646 [Lolium multiflorum]